METEYIYFILFVLTSTISVQFIQSFQYGVYLQDSDPYKQFNDIGIKQCAKRCFAEVNCQSFNFLKIRYTCTLSQYKSSQKQLLVSSEYTYGDRSHMAQVTIGLSVKLTYI